MIIFLCIIGYFLIGFITGLTICKIKGKEWCKADNVAGFGIDELSWDNNAECIMYISTFLWVLFIMFSPFIIIHYIITYTSKKLQE